MTFKENESVVYLRPFYGAKKQKAKIISYQSWDGKYVIAIGRGAKPPSIEYVNESTLSKL